VIDRNGNAINIKYKKANIRV